jgi:hypothetical protein
MPPPRDYRPQKGHCHQAKRVLAWSPNASDSLEDAQRRATAKERAMGDKGGKKDKSKSQKQKDQKQQQKVKSGPDKQQTKKP